MDFLYFFLNLITFLRKKKWFLRETSFDIKNGLIENFMLIFKQHIRQLLFRVKSLCYEEFFHFSIILKFCIHSHIYDVNEETS